MEGRVRSENDGINWVIFFFKQKTAYEMLRSLVGSEMCIRDRNSSVTSQRANFILKERKTRESLVAKTLIVLPGLCLLYTSDAADDLLCVDLGGRRIIKKKTRLILNAVGTTEV